MKPSRPNVRTGRRVLFALALAAGLAACDRGAETPEPAATGDESAAENTEGAANAGSAEPAAPVVPCALAAGEVGIQNLQLRSADGSCRLYLPVDAAPGTYQIRVSAVGRDDAAAVEATTADGPLYATAGTVTITAADANRIAGTVDASDDAEPVIGVVRTEFDVAIGGQ